MTAPKTTGIAASLGSLQHMRRQPLAVETPERSDAQTPKRSGVQEFKRLELPLQGTAKSKHPDFAKKTLYLRKSTMRDALRRYEDEGGDEESELVERLLLGYVRGGFRA